MKMGAQDLDVQRSIDGIGQALIAMADAALISDEVVKTVAATSFAIFADGGSASVLERSGEDWKHADDRSDVPTPLARMLNAVSQSAQVSRVEGVGVLVSVNSGSIGVLLRNLEISESRWPALRILATGFELALASAMQSRGKLDALEEIRGFQQIARRILCAGDLDEILFSICQETKRLLAADICGVFLRDQDYMVMRDCVGNQTKNIEKIRLARGQGLAGRVFETGLHCVVSDYLTSEILTQENADLVRSERIRSALGAPLRVSEELIGVLEVWRRRKSTFTEADVRRIRTLASLTAIAINNAELYGSQKSVVEQLTVANETLQKQNVVIRQSANITDEFIQALLDGEGLPAISRIVASYANAEMAFLTSDFETMAGLPTASWLDEFLPLMRQAAAENHAQQNRGTITLQFSDRWMSLRPVIAGRDRVGWVCALSEEKPAQLQEIAIGQAAMACALNYQEQHAAARARADTRSGILWDLLEGTVYARQAAANRAKEQRIDLSGSIRIVHLTAEGLAANGDSDKPLTEAVEHKLRLVQEIFERGFSKAGVLRLMAVRGSLFVAAITTKESQQIKAILKSVGDSITLEVSNLQVFWGVSAPCDAPGNLHTAHSEAASATVLVRKLGFGKNVAIHEELGVIGLLLKVRSDADLGKFVRDTLSKVIAHDSKHHGVLMRTVRTYFDCNCAQQAASQKLYVHEKTVRYRLTQFQTLTGLDLNNHEDRMLVHLAIGMYSIAFDKGDEENDGPRMIGTASGSCRVSSTD
ncbi:MAG: helix-turn-helix domain-containing protein [Burkholderiales bacterium]|nr:helix-turn-helix domain-containing protein [Burkholderiales bacterium]